MDKLAEILAGKRTAHAGVPATPPAALRAAGAAPRPGFLDALAQAPGGFGVIAEIKRRSPSAGAIAPTATALDQALTYRHAGADCLSILTDTEHFGGSLADLADVTRHFATQPPALPCLRKDFFVHTRQIEEAARAGASAILLIVRALDDAALRDLHAAAGAAGLDALFEVHTEEEIDRAAAAGARLIGVNNRDLAVFRTDLALTERLLPRVPPGILRVSESGIWTGADAQRVRAAGAQAILVGEALMRAPDPAALLRAFRTPA